MKFQKLLYLLTFLSIVVMATRVSVASDTFWHLRAGDWIVEHGQILREDPFSLTRFGETWRYPGWLAQVLMISSYRLLGFPGLNIFTTVFVLIGLAFTWRAMKGSDFARVTVLLLAAITSAVYWSARPHIMTFALTGLVLYVLEDYRNRERNRLWILPLGMALWGNLHGGFAAGFILILLYLVGEILEAGIEIIKARMNLGEALRSHQRATVNYAGFGLLSAIALSINPHGPRMILYPFTTIGIESLRDYIQEWQSPNFHEPQVYPFLFSLLLLLLVFAATKKRVAAHEYLATATFLVLALTAGRNIALYALVVSPVLSRHLSSSLEPLAVRFQNRDEFDPTLAGRLNLALLFLCLFPALIKISYPLNPEVNREALGEQFPYGAVEFIKSTEPEGPMFNSYNWGAFIIWELYPEYRSFVDGRTDLFNDEILLAYLSAWRGESGWEEFLDQWGIKIVFVEPEAPLRHKLLQSGWMSIYEDEQA
ncbi:MAG: hypothetical protein P1P76_11940, partial [Anaerolineales bacterium]|nr:hypothetical protein [Anaerolineales bacterium]